MGGFVWRFFFFFSQAASLKCSWAYATGAICGLSPYTSWRSLSTALMLSLGSDQILVCAQL